MSGQEIYLSPLHCEDMGTKYFKTSSFKSTIGTVRSLRMSWDSKHTEYFNRIEDAYGGYAVIEWRRIDDNDTKKFGFVKPQSPGWFYVWKVDGERKFDHVR